MGPRIKMNFQKWDLNQEDGREVIEQWSYTRHVKMQGLRKKYYKKFLLYTFNISTCRSFIANFNFMVIFQMMLAALSVYIFDYFDISFDFHVSLFVSPIVFPLAFSINTDFQRREKVLEDLANFKSSSMLWFFCMREWKVAAGLEDEWLDSVHRKVKNMMFNLREYLLTDKVERRRYIARCLYEDFSDANQLIERVRASNLPSNTAIISRVIHLLNMLCLSFERLRVVREYRSPRSIRSFNKVLILLLPIILSPYFVYLSRKETMNSKWGSYYIAVLVAAVFGSLQGVQDKLDDPFDGMSEDDIQLQTIDDWTFNNLEVVRNRNFTVGRFHVSARIDDVPEPSTGLDKIDHLSIPTESSRGGIFGGKIFKKNSRKKRKSSVHRSMSTSSRHGHAQDQDAEHHMFDPQNHPYADALQNIKGSSRVQAVKKTGKFLVTDHSAFDQQKSNSSIESYQSTPEEKRLTDLFKQSTIQSDVEKQDENQSDSSVKQKEPIETKVDFEPIKTKEVTFSIATPQRSTSPSDSINESESTLVSPSRQPLISEEKKKPPSSNRFKLNCVAPPKTLEVIENNNAATVIPLHEYNRDNLDDGDSFDELVIQNAETISIKKNDSPTNALPQNKEFEV